MNSKMKICRVWLIGAGLILCTANLRADFLILKLPALASLPQAGPGAAANSPGGDDDNTIPAFIVPPQPTAQAAGAPELRLVLPGQIQVNPGRTITFKHATIKDPLIFNIRNADYRKAATPQQEFNKRLVAAAKDPEALMKAAMWALKKGLLREFYSAVDKTLEAAPRHAAATRIKELKKKFDQPIPDNPEVERELRGYVKVSGMQAVSSKHFVLLTDVPTKPVAGRRKGRPQERLDLLEEVYESFLLLFHAQNIELDIPTERMKVLLFSKSEDFDAFSASVSPTLVSASGFYEPIRNVSAFYDHSSSKTFEVLERWQANLRKQVDAARRARNAAGVRELKMLDMLVEIDRENADITVVSHEAAHQMAANTGLLPRHVEIPRWVHEGLATYFEAPADAAWAGIGAVSDDRLKFYRALEGDRMHSNIDFIVADQVFDFARTQGAVLHGYGQAWALTHFLIENHLKELVAYYRILGEMPPNVPLNPNMLTDVFNHVFGKDHKALDQEWRQYMSSLKTDAERLEEAAPATGGGRGRSSP